MSKEQQLCGRRRAERIYSTFKVRRGSHEEIPLVQSKEQRLHYIQPESIRNRWAHFLSVFHTNSKIVKEETENKKKK